MPRRCDRRKLAVRGIAQRPPSAPKAPFTLSTKPRQCRGRAAPAAEELSSLDQRDQPPAQPDQQPVSNAVSEPASPTMRSAGSPGRRRRLATWFKLIHKRRRADQPAGSQCHHRGGAPRASRARFRVVASEVKSPPSRLRERRPDRRPDRSVQHHAHCSRKDHQHRGAMNEISEYTESAAASVHQQECRDRRHLAECCERYAWDQADRDRANRCGPTPQPKRVNQPRRCSPRPRRSRRSGRPAAEVRLFCTGRGLDSSRP